MKRSAVFFTPVRPVCFAAVGLVFTLTACSASAQETPLAPDFALTVVAGNGSLPPEYKWDYEIQVGPGTQGQVTAWTGYDRDTAVSRYFAIDPDLPARLQTEFLSADLGRAKEGEVAAGGARPGLRVVMNGETTHVSGWLDSPWAGRVRNLVNEVKDQVPLTVWAGLSETLGISLKP